MLNVGKACFAFLFSLLLMVTVVHGQYFNRVNDEVGVSVMNGNSLWGSGVSFFDVNEDGWDDITICIGNAPTRYYENNNGVFELSAFFPNDKDSKACVWGDYDEDGDNDLIVLRRDAPCQYFRNNNGQFSDVSQELSLVYGPNIWSWGMAAGDIDRDGFLDLYVANYGLPSAKNALLRNSENGTFWNDLSSVLIEYTKTSFQPAWVDLNYDLWPDLYVINDRSQRNDYYEQISSGVFQDKSVETGLGISIDAMSNSMNDFDLDGDFDFYITNINGNRLLKNTNLLFTNAAPTLGVELMQWSWSGLWLDLENDGWSDLFVATEHLSAEYPQHHTIYRNYQGSMSAATDDELTVLPYGGFSSAKGDLNHDGKYDLLLGAESAQFFNVFKNAYTGENNSFKFRLEGRCSNRNGFGTRYEIFVNGQKYMGYTQSSDNYISQNSQNIIQGIGTASKIDSLNLYWISGIVDHYEQLESDSLYVLVEAHGKDRVYASQEEICTLQDSVLLSIPFWQEVEWFDGDTSHQKWVVGPGFYTAQVGTGFGKSIEVSETIVISQFPQVVTEVINPICAHENSGAFTAYNAEDSSVYFSNANLYAGVHTYSIFYGNGCMVTDSITLIDPLPLDWNLTCNSVLCNNESNGSIFLSAVGGTAPYFINTNEIVDDAFSMENLSAGFYAVELLDNHGCLKDSIIQISEPSPLVIEYSYPSDICLNDSTQINWFITGGTPPISSSNSENYFPAGTYHFDFIDSQGCTAQADIQISELPPTQWSATTLEPSNINDGEIHLELLNCTGCNAIWNTGDTTLQLTGLGEGSYTFTVIDNWGCSTSGQVDLIFNHVIQTENLNVNWICNSNGFVHAGRTIQHDVKCFDSSGRLVAKLNQIAPQETFSVPNMSTGIYFIVSNEGNWKVPVYDLK